MNVLKETFYVHVYTFSCILILCYTIGTEMHICEDRLFIGCFIHMYMYVHGMSSGTGVEFGSRIINIDGKKIKVQIWDTVSETEVTP